MTQIQIEITHLKKTFGTNEVLKDINFSLAQGENVVVMGKSGCGKSVLIKCIVGLIKPDGGFLRVFGKDIASLHQHELDRLRERIGFVFQNSALYDSMTVRENLVFPMRMNLKKKSKEEVEFIVRDVLESVGLLNAIDMMPSELSGGMRKRIGLARSVILNPEIILYDEPTTGLDPITAREISQLMLKLQQKNNASSVIISHDMACARLTSNRMCLMTDGSFYAEGTYSELEKSADTQVKMFFE